MIVIKDNQVYSDDNKFIHRIGTNSYFKKGTILKNDIESNFEEVDELPDSNLNQVKEAKLIEINSYDKSKDVESFYINDKRLWLTKEQRSAIDRQIIARENNSLNDITLSFLTDNNEMIFFTIDNTKAKGMLDLLEIYAGDALNATNKHIQNILKLTTVEDINNYNYTTNYPDKLNFKIDI